MPNIDVLVEFTIDTKKRKVIILITFNNSEKYKFPFFFFVRKFLNPKFGCYQNTFKFLELGGDIDRDSKVNLTLVRSYADLTQISRPRNLDESIDRLTFNLV